MGELENSLEGGKGIFFYVPKKIIFKRKDGPK